MRTSRRTASLAAAAFTATALLGSLSLASSASAATPSATPVQQTDDANADRNLAALNSFMAEHPDDYAGMDALSMKLTGHHIGVSFDGIEGTYTGAQAQELLDAQAEQPKTSGIAPMSIPSSSFTVSIWQAYVSSTKTAVYGKWNFKDDFIGGDNKADFASLSFKVPSCVNLTGHAAYTYKWDGTKTSSSSLRSANTGANAPIWNIIDKISNFERSNDNGYVTVVLQNGCGKAQKNLQADFSYEANDGSSAVSVSAGWGFLSISYGGSTSVMQKGTAPITFSM